MERIVIKDVPDNVKYFMSLPNGIEKNVYRSKIDNTFIVVSYMKDDDNNEFFSAETKFITQNGNSYYCRTKDKHGLSFKNGKVKIWFGKSLISIPYIDELFKIKKWDFIEPGFKGYITKTSLTKLFNGKITNSRDLIKHYIKSVRIDCSVEKLYKTIKLTKLNKSTFYRHAITAKNVDNFLTFWDNNYKDEDYHIRHTINDLIYQSNIVNTKIDYKWSENRMKSEHKRLTRIIMGYELKHLEEEVIEYPDVELPYGFELLNTKKQIFSEGMEMNHCVYTNYWETVRRYGYVVFHIRINGEVATLGCSLNKLNGEMSFSQVYQYDNKPVSKDTSDYCKAFAIDNRDMFKEFLKSKNLLYKAKSNETHVEIPNDLFAEFDFVN